MSRLATEWALWMLPVAWQITLLVAVVWTLDLLLRRVVWPQLLYGLWLLVPLCALLPAFGSAVSTGAVAVAPADPPLILLMIWASGVAVFGVLAVAVILRQRRGLRGSVIEDPILARAAQQLGIRRRVALAASPHIASPVVYGIFRPRIVVPDSPMSAAEREHVYLHELAHVQRGDLLVSALYGLVHLLFWFHPLLYVARRRAHGLRELCCDARVASVLRDRTPEYRRTLLRFAARLLPQPGLTGFLGGPSVILLRLRWLDRGEWVFSRRRRVATAAVILILTTTLVPRAQAGVIDPAVASLHAEMARLDGRIPQLSLEHEGCFELRWTVQRILQLERQIEESK
ncbi:MAG: M56 family metallopeptidase [Planctomycetota bacterium]